MANTISSFIFRVQRGLLFLACLALSFGPWAAGSESLYFGSAKTEITPKPGTPLAGYGRYRGKPTRGVHDPLFARAAALHKNDQTFVFLSADLVLIDEEMRMTVLKKIKKQIPFQDSQLVMFATHTHTGAGAVGGRFWERFIMGKRQKNVFEKMTNQMADIAIQAVKEKIPVTAEYAETRIDDLIENRMDEKLEVPATMKVLRFKNERNEIKGMMLFMAAHATLAPASEALFSADYPGALLRTLEEKYPESAALFVNGAAGDLRPKAGPIEDRFEKLAVYGKILADKAASLSFQSISLEGPWKSDLQKIRLPRSQIRLGWFKFPFLIGDRVFPNKPYFQILRLGSLAFITFPGEVSAESGFEAEMLLRSKSLTPFFVGYANDYVGYMVPRRYYKDRSQYESRTSFYGEKLEWFFLELTRLRVNSLLTEEEKTKMAPAGLLKSQEDLPVLTLSGDDYHIGYEEGRLLGPEIRKGVDDIFAYFRKELPVPLINRMVINIMANRAWKKMEPYLTYGEYLQIKGLSDGSGVSFKKLKQIHAMPEIYPTLCANGAYWGKATADGKLIALRNLDWNRKMGIQNRAAVKWIAVPGRKSYANIGYYGFTGVLSGINEEGISVGQIGAASSDETLEGTPMPFLLKRVLENAGDLESAASLFEIYPKTQGYNYVIADAEKRDAIVIEATRNHLAFFGDEDPREKEVSYAMVLENAVFRGDPAIDPAIRDLQIASQGNPKKPGFEMPAGSAYEIRYRKQGELAQSYYGKITPEIAQEIAREIAPGSNIQSVVYAYPDFWVANAKEDKKAAESGYVRFNMDELSGNAS